MGTWLSGVTLAGLLAAVMTAGGYRQQIDDHERRIRDIEPVLSEVSAQIRVLRGENTMMHQSIADQVDFIRSALMRIEKHAGFNSGNEDTKTAGVR